MTARQEAIDAGALALWKRDGWLPDDYPEKALIHRVSVAAALDAIPDDTLVRYAIERGALRQHPTSAPGLTLYQAVTALTENYGT